MIAPDVRRVGAEKVFEALSVLKEEGYNVLVDMTAVDYSAWPEPKPADPYDKTYRMTDEGNAVRKPKPIASRFDVIYHLMKLDAVSGEDGGRVELHAAVDEDPVLRSAMALWPIADWLEREIWDMFGIRFTDRPDIKRLLLYEEFQGHPLRKDYPINKRQPLIGPASGEPAGNPSFNHSEPTVKYD
ncbi:MAG: NADH-quinone oxidoreductase subunit C [Elusimicrobiota bacterium]